MKEPTFPAIIMEMRVGENSKIMDCLVAKAIKVLGINGFVKFNAVCMATTPPIKKEIKATIPKDPIIKSSISLRTSCFM
ncbi:hypothetical protein D3C80_1690580 [compost metagenome]